MINSFGTNKAFLKINRLFSNLNVKLRCFSNETVSFYEGLTRSHSVKFDSVTGDLCLFYQLMHLKVLGDADTTQWRDPGLFYLSRVTEAMANNGTVILILS